MRDVWKRDSRRSEASASGARSPLLLGRAAGKVSACAQVNRMHAQRPKGWYSHWYIAAKNVTFVAVGTRGPAIALHLTTYNGGQVFSYNAKDDEYSDIPLQKKWMGRS